MNQDDDTQPGLYRPQMAYGPSYGPPTGQQPPAMPPGPGGPPPTPGKKPRRWVPFVITGVVAFMIGSASGHAASDDTAGNTAATATATATATVTETEEAPADEPTDEPAPPKKTTKPKPKKPRIGDGTYLVGKEIARGQWKSSGEAGGFCYADTQTKSGKIIDQQVSSGEPVVIRIGRSAYTFKSSDCGKWRRVG